MHASGRQTVTVEYIETAALDADGLALLSQTLSDEERARAARFHFELDRGVERRTVRVLESLHDNTPHYATSRVSLLAYV